MTLRDWFAGLGLAAAAVACVGQTCTTQSGMAAADRDGLSAAALMLARGVQADDAAAVKASTDADLGKQFAAVTELMGQTSPHLKGSVGQVEQVYLLDASSMTGASDAQFDCSLNHSAQSVEFQIPQLPAAKYGFAIVRFPGTMPWQVSLLLRQDAGRWLMAGLYPKAMTAGGHDGVWYWQTARGMLVDRHAWDAWLYFQEAEQLLQPAGFVTSSHLDKLGTELQEAAPPPVKGGLSATQPLVIKGAGGEEFRFTQVGVNDSLGNAKPDVEARMKVDALGDAVMAKKRNADAAAALVGAHPELRESFHGVLVLAEVAGQNPYTTEESMAEIR